MLGLFVRVRSDVSVRHCKPIFEAELEAYREFARQYRNEREAATGLCIRAPDVYGLPETRPLLEVTFPKVKLKLHRLHDDDDEEQVLKNMNLGSTIKKKKKKKSSRTKAGDKERSFPPINKKLPLQFLFPPPGDGYYYHPCRAYCDAHNDFIFFTDEQFGPEPVNMTCYYCARLITTVTEPACGLGTDLLCMSYLLKWLLGKSCDPYMCVGWKITDTEHYCPNCDSYLGIYRFI